MKRKKSNLIVDPFVLLSHLTLLKVKIIKSFCDSGISEKHVGVLLVNVRSIDDVEVLHDVSKSFGVDCYWYEVPFKSTFDFVFQLTKPYCYED